jgi:hypothetical protein
MTCLDAVSPDDSRRRKDHAQCALSHIYRVEVTLTKFFASDFVDKN